VDVSQRRSLHDSPSRAEDSSSRPALARWRFSGCTASSKTTTTKTKKLQKTKNKKPRLGFSRGMD
jgi:hypothetical protein